MASQQRATSFQVKHPVEKLQEVVSILFTYSVFVFVLLCSFVLVFLQKLKQKEAKKFYTLANVYGSHWPMKIKMEKFTLSQPRRMAGLPSAASSIVNAALDGTDEDFGFEDKYIRKLFGRKITTYLTYYRS